MRLDYLFLVRFLAWGVCSFYLWRSALVPKDAQPKGKFDRSLRLLGAVITAWLALVAMGRGLGLFRYL